MYIQMTAKNQCPAPQGGLLDPPEDVCFYPKTTSLWVALDYDILCLVV